MDTWIEVANDRAAAALRDGQPKLQVFSELQKALDNRPRPEVNPALVTQLLEFLDQLEDFGTMAQSALNDGGAKPLDAAIAPGTATRSIALGVQINRALSAYRALRIGLSQPDLIPDEHLSTAMALATQFRHTADELEVACRVIEPKPDSKPPQSVPASEVRWTDVQARLVAMYDRGDPYTSVNALAKRLGCGNATVQKAIKPSQASLERLEGEARAEAVAAARKLAGWQARAISTNGAPRAISINEVVADKAEQTREADPAKETECDDWDIEFARLIEDAEPDERARLNELDDDGRRELVALVREDPDRYDTLLGRRP